MKQVFYEERTNRLFIITDQKKVQYLPITTHDPKTPVVDLEALQEEMEEVMDYTKKSLNRATGNFTASATPFEKPPELLSRNHPAWKDPRRPVLVMAASYESFTSHWTRSILPIQATYISKEEQLHGYIDPTIIRIPGWEENPVYKTDEFISRLKIVNRERD